MYAHFEVQSGHLSKIQGGEWFFALHILTCVSMGKWKEVDGNAKLGT